MSEDKFTRKVGNLVQNPYIVLLTYIMTVFSFFDIGSDNIWVIGAIYTFICLYLAFLTIYICKRYFSIKKFKDNLVKKTNSDNEEVVKMLLEFSNTIVENSLKVKKKKSLDYDHFKNMVKNICSIIHKIVLQISGEEFSVCVKAFSLNELIETNYDNMATVTIARETKDFVKRSENDNQRQTISSNTSFKTLLDTGDFLWSCPDLTKIDPKLVVGSSYKNPDDYYRNFYKSTIVVPIRTKMENVDPSIIEYSDNSKDVTYHYLGFLCIDSMQKFREDQAEFTKLYNVLILLGGALYPLLENYLVNEIEKV